MSRCLCIPNLSPFMYYDLYKLENVSRNIFLCFLHLLHNHSVIYQYHYFTISKYLIPLMSFYSSFYSRGI